MLNAENAPYFKSGTAHPDKWFKLARKELESIGGKIRSEGWATDDKGRGAFLLSFDIPVNGASEHYKITWPMLPCKSDKNLDAARLQAATALYHDIKARVVSAKFLGSRSSFAGWLMLPDGKTVSESNGSQVLALLPEAIR